MMLQLAHLTGLTHNGLITVRDTQAIPLPSRAKITKAVNEENQDRRALYREIASANKHPEWEGQIQYTFAKRWISRAQRGWWYQDAQGRIRRASTVGCVEVFAKRIV